MREKLQLIFALISIIIGLVFLFNSVQGITGNAILEEFAVPVSNLLAMIMIFVGIVLFMAKKQYEVRLDTGAHVMSAEYHGVVYYRGKRTNLNTTVERNRVYIGEHGKGYDLDPDSLGQKPLKIIGRETMKKLRGKPTRPRGAMKKVRDITNKL